MLILWISNAAPSSWYNEDQSRLKHVFSIKTRTPEENNADVKWVGLQAEQRLLLTWILPKGHVVTLRVGQISPGLLTFIGIFFFLDCALLRVIAPANAAAGSKEHLNALTALGLCLRGWVVVVSTHQVWVMIHAFMVDTHNKAPGGTEQIQDDLTGMLRVQSSTIYSKATSKQSSERIFSLPPSASYRGFNDF